MRKRSGSNTCWASVQDCVDTFTATMKNRCSASRMKSCPLGRNCDRCCPLLKAASQSQCLCSAKVVAEIGQSFPISSLIPKAQRQCGLEPSRLLKCDMGSAAANKKQGCATCPTNGPSSA